MKKYFIMGLVLLPLIGIAQNLKIDPPAPGLGTDAWEFIDIIIQIITWFVVPVIALVIIYSGYEMATAQGDTKKIESGKKRLYGAIIGLIVILVSGYVIDIIKNTGEVILN